MGKDEVDATFPRRDAKLQRELERAQQLVFLPAASNYCDPEPEEDGPDVESGMYIYNKVNEAVKELAEVSGSMFYRPYQPKSPNHLVTEDNRLMRDSEGYRDRVLLVLRGQAIPESRDLEAMQLTFREMRGKLFRDACRLREEEREFEIKRREDIARAEAEDRELAADERAAKEEDVIVKAEAVEMKAEQREAEAELNATRAVGRELEMMSRTLWQQFIVHLSSKN